MKRARSMNPRTFPSTLAIVAAGMLLVGPTIAHATPILIDFNDVAPAPTFGGTWNTVPDTSASIQLVDATGATTSLSLSFGDNWTSDDLQVSFWSHGNTAWIDGNAAMDHLSYDFTENQPGTIAIAGLATDLVYRIDLLAAQEFSVPLLGTADFSIFGSFGDSVPNGNNFNVHTDGLVNGNFITWNAVTPSASGQVLIQVAGSDDTNPHMLGSAVSAARITCLRPSAAGVPQEVVCPPAAVPEPGTIVLLAVGVLGICVTRARALG
ncbi:MAG TPA: PEP-CTERM sorting domain-containing protein [Casimicrobiaceae bacterium]